MKSKLLQALLISVALAGCTSFQEPADDTVVVDVPEQDAGVDEGLPGDEGRPDQGRTDTTIDEGGSDVEPDEGGTDANVGQDDGGQDSSLPPDVQPVDNGQDAAAPRGRISVAGYLIDFGFVPLAAESTVPFEIENVGDGALRLDKFVTTGSKSIVLDVGFEGQVSGTKTTYVISPAKVLKPGAKFGGKVVFKPTDANEAYTEIRIFSSDADYPDGYVMHAMGNKIKPAVEINPSSIDFGATVIGTPVSRSVTIKSVGGMNVKIRGVAASSPSIEAGWRVEFPNGEPTVASPITLAPLETLNVTVVYDPTRASPVNAIGMPQIEEGQIVVSGDMFAGNAYQRVTGMAVSGACTLPIVDFLNEYSVDGEGCPVLSDYPADDKNTRICKTTDGWEVPTGTLLRLSGAQSFSPFGNLVTWNWTAAQPAANTGFFVPTANEVEPTFMVGAAAEAGTPYEIFLNVIDSLGYESCSAKSVKITTRVEVKADILLSWKPVNPFTPTPPFMGQDVDLHFTHYKAGDDGNEPDIDNNGVPDDWFDLPYDCFWFNPEPEKFLWGEASPWINDRVVLRNDSDDGMEPEVLMMGIECPNGRPFKVGAHFFDDHGYGQADVTIQIYAKGQLLHTATRRLSSLDMWYIGDLKCKTVGLEKTAEFTVNTVKPVTANYVNNDFGNP